MVYDDGRRGYVWEGNHRISVAIAEGAKTLPVLRGRKKIAKRPGVSNPNSLPNPRERYVRFGGLPESGYSKNYATGETERGVSVYREVQVDGTWYLDNKNGAGLTTFNVSGRPKYEVDGELIGPGSDDEPVLGNASIVRRLKDGLRPPVAVKAVGTSDGRSYILLDRSTGLYQLVSMALARPSAWTDMEGIRRHAKYSGLPESIRSELGLEESGVPNPTPERTINFLPNPMVFAAFNSSGTVLGTVTAPNRQEARAKLRVEGARLRLPPAPSLYLYPMLNLKPEQQYAARLG